MTVAPVAQGINKTVAFAKQAALGTPATIASPGQFIKRVTYISQAERDTFDNNEISTHQQSTGVSYGLKKATSKLTGLLRAGAYALFFAASLRKDFVAGCSTGAIITVASASTSGAAGTLTRSAGSYLTDGFKIGDIVRVTGFATTGAVNNSKNMLIIALSATVMTIVRFDGAAVGAKIAGDSVTIAVVGKKTLAPLSGHTNDYFSSEEWYGDISKSELMQDLRPGTINIGVPANGNSTFDCDFVGLARDPATVQVMSAATAEFATSVLTGLNGIVFIGGAVFNVTGVKLTLNGNVKAGEAEVGSDTSSDVTRGRIMVSGEFTALFRDTTIQDIYNAETPTGIVAVSMDNKNVGTSDFVGFSMSRLKITGDAPDDGEKQIIRTYPFTAEININGGAALANDMTILSIQDSQAA